MALVVYNSCEELRRKKDRWAAWVQGLMNKGITPREVDPAVLSQMLHDVKEYYSKCTKTGRVPTFLDQFIKQAEGRGGVAWKLPKTMESIRDSIRNPFPGARTRARDEYEMEPRKRVRRAAKAVANTHSQDGPSEALVARAANAELQSVPVSATSAGFGGGIMGTQGRQKRPMIDPKTGIVVGNPAALPTTDIHAVQRTGLGRGENVRGSYNGVLAPITQYGGQIKRRFVERTRLDERPAFVNGMIVNPVAATRSSFADGWVPPPNPHGNTFEMAPGPDRAQELAMDLYGQPFNRAPGIIGQQLGQDTGYRYGQPVLRPLSGDTGYRYAHNMPSAPATQPDMISFTPVAPSGRIHNMPQSPIATELPVVPVSPASPVTPLKPTGYYTADVPSDLNVGNLYQDTPMQDADEEEPDAAQTSPAVAAPSSAEGSPTGALAVLFSSPPPPVPVRTPGSDAAPPLPRRSQPPSTPVRTSSINKRGNGGGRPKRTTAGKPPERFSPGTAMMSPADVLNSVGKEIEKRRKAMGYKAPKKKNI